MSLDGENQNSKHIECTGKHKVGQRMEAAIIRNICHDRHMKHEWEALENARKRVEKETRQRMNVFLKQQQQKHGYVTGRETTESLLGGKKKHSMPDQYKQKMHKSSTDSSLSTKDYCIEPKHLLGCELHHSKIAASFDYERRFCKSVNNCAEDSLSNDMTSSNPSSKSHYLGLPVVRARRSFPELKFGGPRLEDIEIKSTTTKASSISSSSSDEEVFITDEESLNPRKSFNNEDQDILYVVQNGTRPRSYTDSSVTRHGDHFYEGKDPPTPCSPKAKLQSESRRYSWNLAKRSESINTTSIDKDIGQKAKDYAQEPQTPIKNLHHESQNTVERKKVISEFKPEYKGTAKDHAPDTEKNGCQACVKESFTLQRKWKKYVQNLSSFTLPAVENDFLTKQHNSAKVAKEAELYTQQGCFITVITKDQTVGDL